MGMRTGLGLRLETYGSSLLGAQLSWFPPSADCKLLIVAGIHGEEPDTTVSLSRAIRSIEVTEIAPSIGLILTANPDGLQLGTRGNVNGVDLNRNFPTANWQADPATCRWHADEDLALPILTGDHGGSEPETAALIELIEMTGPARILALHGPLAELPTFGEFRKRRRVLAVALGFPGVDPLIDQQDLIIREAPYIGEVGELRAGVPWWHVAIVDDPLDGPRFLRDLFVVA